mmetsp:Transcript_22620/g.34481  ORF Transcript_22620/g.34481 Transcript_22620/m.34481 type:complete len:259 (+) Transcript_22620:90-866(+)
MIRQASSIIKRTVGVNNITSPATLTVPVPVRCAHNVRVILTSDLPDGRGYSGDVQDVKAGYARNYLIPQKKALYATPQNFIRVDMVDPNTVKETAEEKAKRLSMESDEDLKAADKLKYYLRNKTLKIWRMVDMNIVSGDGSGSDGDADGKGSGSPRLTGSGVPIHPGKVIQSNVRSKLSKQLLIDLDKSEKVQIHPVAIPHVNFELDPNAMDKALEDMADLEEGENCDVEIKTLGEYLCKIHLTGGYHVGLRLQVTKR